MNKIIQHNLNNNNNVNNVALIQLTAKHIKANLSGMNPLLFQLVHSVPHSVTELSPKEEGFRVGELLHFV